MVKSLTQVIPLAFHKAEPKGLNDQVFLSITYSCAGTKALLYLTRHLCRADNTAFFFFKDCYKHSLPTKRCTESTNGWPVLAFSFKAFYMAITLWLFCENDNNNLYYSVKNRKLSGIRKCPKVLKLLRDRSAILNESFWKWDTVFVLNSFLHIT